MELLINQDSENQHIAKRSLNAKIKALGLRSS